MRRLIPAFQFVQQRLHLRRGVRVAGALGRGETSLQAFDRLFVAVDLCQRLGRHLVGRHVVRVVGGGCGELPQRGVGIAVAQVGHGQAVAGETVGRIVLQNFREHGDLVHAIIVRAPAVRRNCTRRVDWEGMEQQLRTVRESQSERSEIIFPGDANSLGNLFGGKLMQFIDLVGAVAAYRHARAILVVTASMDGLDFVAPVHVGDLLILKASVNRAFRTSMEVGVKAMVEDPKTRSLRHVSTAYVTYVAVNATGTPMAVEQIVPETEHEKRRYEDAMRRRESRAGEVQRKREMRKTLTMDWHA